MSGSAEELALDLAREIAQARSHVYPNLLYPLLFMANSMLSGSAAHRATSSQPLAPLF